MPSERLKCSVLHCAESGDSITFDQPTINYSEITQPLIINKIIDLVGVSESDRPEIIFDYSQGSVGLQINENATLRLNDVDLKFMHFEAKPTVTGPGNCQINGYTRVSEN